MVLLLRAVYHRLESHSLAISITEVVNLGVLVDKYDCVGVVNLISTSWLETLLDKSQIENYHHLLKAAYLLDNLRVFGIITQKLITTSTGLDAAFEKLVDPEKVLPAHIFCEYYQ